VSGCKLLSVVETNLFRFEILESKIDLCGPMVTLLLVVRVRRWIPGGKRASRKLHTVARGAGYVREPDVRDRPAASRVPGQGGNRLQYLLCKGG
jgi:hypothetical protein